MIDFILQSIGEIISFILGVIVMLIMGLAGIFNKAQMKRKDENNG